LQILDNKQTLVERDEPKYNPVFVWAYYDRAVTYKRINERVDKMLEAGWINEVESLLKLNKDLTSLNALKAIGYQQIIDSLTNNTKLDVEKIKTLTRHYAKRQLTWIRNHYNDAIKIYNLNINELII
jgi:tRNA dimethylallyltransferase